MRAVSVDRLERFRIEIWENAGEKRFGLFSPSIYLPDDDIKTIFLDHFNLLKSADDIAWLVKDNEYFESCHANLLLSVLCELRPEFDRIKAEDNARRNAKAKKTREANKQAMATEFQEAGSGSDGEQPLSDDDPVQAGDVDSRSDEQSRITWRINSTHVFPLLALIRNSRICTGSQLKVYISNNS
jgi:hypothetical protein